MTFVLFSLNGLMVLYMVDTEQHQAIVLGPIFEEGFCDLDIFSKFARHISSIKCVYINSDQEGH
jgi:hypothetical protein